MPATPKVRWYVIQTYSGQENAVKKDLESRIQSMGMSAYIHKVLVPEEKIIEKVPDKTNPDKKIDKEKIVQVYPGYVFVQMEVTDESWYIVRNTPKVTGFLGSSGGGTKPIPLQEDEIRPVLLKAGAILRPNLTHLVGQDVKITVGGFAGQVGKVTEIDNDTETLIISLDLFGRATPVTISFDHFETV